MKKCNCCGDVETGHFSTCYYCYNEFLDNTLYTGLDLNDFIDIKKNKKLIKQRSKKIKNILNEKM
jgi:hypothetical protein